MDFTDYFSIEAILAQEERIPVTFKTDVYHLGHLDPGSLDEDIHSGTRIDLPLWLSRILCTRNIAEMSLPKAYSQKFLSNLKADPISVSLGSVAPYFYELALELANFIPDQNNEVPKLLEILQNAKVLRYKMILDKSQNMRNTDLHEVTRKLTLTEKKLFEAGYTASIQYETWKNRCVAPLSQSLVLGTTRKRKAENLSTVHL